MPVLVFLFGETLYRRVDLVSFFLGDALKLLEGGWSELHQRLGRCGLCVIVTEHDFGSLNSPEEAHLFLGQGQSDRLHPGLREAQPESTEKRDSARHASQT